MATILMLVFCLVLVGCPSAISADHIELAKNLQNMEIAGNDLTFVKFSGAYPNGWPANMRVPATCLLNNQGTIETTGVHGSERHMFLATGLLPGQQDKVQAELLQALGLQNKPPESFSAAGITELNVPLGDPGSKDVFDNVSIGLAR